MKKQIDVVEALDLMSSGKLVESGHNISFLAVIEPKTYDMADGQIFFRDFALTFTSTDEKIRDDIAGSIENWMEENTTKKLAFFVDLDDFKKRLQGLAQKEMNNLQFSLNKFDDCESVTSAAEVFVEVVLETLQNLLAILLMNADVIHMFSYDIHTDIGDFFWTYAGTQKLDMHQVKEKFNAKVDWLSENNCRIRKSFIPIITEI